LTSAHPCLASLPNCNIIFCIQSSSKQQLQTLAYLLNSTHKWWLVASLGCNHDRFWPRDNRHRLVLVSVATSLRLERSRNIIDVCAPGMLLLLFCAWAGMLKPGHSTPPTHTPTHTHTHTFSLQAWETRARTRSGTSIRCAAERHIVTAETSVCFLICCPKRWKFVSDHARPAEVQPPSLPAGLSRRVQLWAARAHAFQLASYASLQATSHEIALACAQRSWW
jgi:hypothetical protein